MDLFFIQNYENYCINEQNFNKLLIKILTLTLFLTNEEAIQEKELFLHNCAIFDA
jgi:hypothetical protein